MKRSLALLLALILLLMPKGGQNTQRETISAGYAHTVGLRSDGTVVAVGNNDDGQCDVSDWTDIALPEKRARN